MVQSGNGTILADECGASHWRISGVQQLLPCPTPVLCIARCDPLLPHFCSHLVQVNHLQCTHPQSHAGKKRAR